MEVSEMLDVLHYLFEEDVNFVSSEHVESRGRVRDIIYDTVYQTNYRYSKSDASVRDYEPTVNLSDASTSEVKPYFPTTNFDPEAANPFQGTLREKPLG